MVQVVWTQGREIQNSGAHGLHALPTQGHYPCLLDPGSAIGDQNVITKLEEGWYFQLEFSEGRTAPFRNKKGPTKTINEHTTWKVGKKHIGMVRHGQAWAGL